MPVANAQPDDIQDLLGGALFKALFKWMVESGPIYLLPTGAPPLGIPGPAVPRWALLCMLNAVAILLRAGAAAAVLWSHALPLSPSPALPCNASPLPACRPRFQFPGHLRPTGSQARAARLRWGPGAERGRMSDGGVEWVGLILLLLRRSRSRSALHLACARCPAPPRPALQTTPAAPSM